MKSNHWQDAPECAQWIGWDADGSAYYYTEFFEVSAGAFSLRDACPQHDNTKKAGQLEKRPEEDS